jgi:3-hydroxyisobutyrate dehydrogenase-like beta-hydroxyacid dehydrogenase
MFAIKGDLINKKNFTPAFPLKHMQKDLRLALALGDILGQSLPSSAAANASFIRARAASLEDEDFCAVFKTLDH